MKRIALTLLFLICATTAFADGPDTKTITGTTSGVAYTVQDSTVAPLQRTVWVSCATDDISILVETWNGAAYATQLLGTGILWPDDEVFAWAGQLVPIEGKFHRLTATTATGDATVVYQIYVD